ncbi:MAG: DUF4388 domain-containing protein, partial [Candidatus Obscuribacterales bacterium]|nr:DUF4388 domain-containing protein [Candidatus Obscuribacterales bacterium]
MFTPKKGIVPEQTYRVESHPTVEVLAQWYAKAKKLTGIKHSFIWEIPELSTCFILSIHCHFESEELEWWLHKETVVDKKMLWFYKTEDVSIIYSQILLAVGATHPNEENREDEAEKKKRTKSLGDRFKKSGTGEIPSIFSESESVQTPPPRTGIGIGSTPPPPTRTLDPTPVPVPVPAPVPVPIPDFPPGLLGGDLRVRAVPVLLQTAEKDELTGHLHVHGPKGEIVVQFGLGRAVHAVGLDTKGSEAIMELFTWREGKAHFEEGKQPESASVQESTDEMLRLGEDYLVNLDFIAENSLDEGSILQKPPIELGDDQFERRIQDGAPLGIKVQKSFYDENDGQLSIKEICAKLRLGRSRGLAVAVNMLKLGLLLTPDNRSLKSIVDSLVAPLIA